jgi:gluconolactonase
MSSNTIKISLLTLAFLFVLTPTQLLAQSSAQATDSLWLPGTKPKQISAQFKFTEGPTADKQGNIYFTDQPNDKIWKYETNGELTLFMDKAGRSNGLYFDKKGNLIACADEQNQLWSISPGKKVTVLLKDMDGKFFNGPNDLWIHPKGGIYFTDPLYKRPYWNESTVHELKQQVYYLPKGKSKPVSVDADVTQPNGIIGSPDGKFLFVADIGASKTYKYEIGKDGILQNKKLFVNQGSDGMTIDNRGNVYLTGKGVTVYNPAGEKIAHINIPAGWTANVTFGGKDKSKLFITAMESIYEMPMIVKGG